MTKKYTYKKYITVSIAVGIIYWLIGEGLFSSLIKKVYTPLGIAVYFALLFIIEAIALTVLTFYKYDWSDTKNRRNKTDAVKTVAIVLCIFSIIAFVFEFLYELGKETLPDPTSIIFLVDDSGSMSSTEEERISAIESVMDNGFADYPYAIYTFSDEAAMIREMGKKDSDSAVNLGLTSSGGTDIVAGAKKVLEDYENGKLNGAGQSPKILLISDGHTYSVGFRSLVKQCAKDNVTISCIGIEGCNRGYLKKLAKNTGGVFVYCSDTASLASGMTQAMNNSASRNLLSERVMFSHDGLYAFMRIAFLSIMGIIWSIMKFLLSDDDSSIGTKTFLCSVFLCTGSSVLLEIGFSYGFSALLLRLIFCVCWAFTPGTTYILDKVRVAGGSVSGGGSGLDEGGDLGKSNIYEMDDKDQSDYKLGDINTGTANEDPLGDDSIFGNDSFGGLFDDDDNSVFGNDSFDDSDDIF